MSNSVTVLIATSNNRNELLINRALNSVYQQKTINGARVSVLIVDDNKHDETNNIQAQLAALRSKLSLNSSEFPTTVMRNQRMRYNSGTGAWNTGIFKVFNSDSNAYIAILDDDDEYRESYLSKCFETLDNNGDTKAIFSRIYWQFPNGERIYLPLQKEQLTPRNFFIGNPGVQGSNMFFKAQALVDIGGFNETYPNTTDRELMIRFLWSIDKHTFANHISIIEEYLVIHHEHELYNVNSDLPLKSIGLNMFYKEFAQHFSKADLDESLKRAHSLFSYNLQNNE